MFAKIYKKLCVEQWIIGIVHADLADFIRNKEFDPDIEWLPFQSKRAFYADPFLVNLPDGGYDILLEEYPYADRYGKIAALTIDAKGKRTGYKILLDAGIHYSYPFVFKQDNDIYVFPESARTGKFSCYRYDPAEKSLKFVKDLLDRPLLDGSIVKRGNKYWLFGVTRHKGSYSMEVYLSENLLGPYTAHSGNPIRDSLDGTRPAGSFIEIDGILYRPAQNCLNQYGESITINKVKTINESEITEDQYMILRINKNRKANRQIHTIHTINSSGNLVVIDGIRYRFSPLRKLREFLRRR